MAKSCQRKGQQAFTSQTSRTTSPFRDDSVNSNSEHTHPRLQRRTSQVKFGCHLATPANVPPLTKRSPGVKSSSTSTPHVIVMVGLPARGKTYISKKLSRYLNWIGMNTKVFNLGDYRRKVEGCAMPSHDFFDTGNAEGMKIRTQVCEDALADMFSWIDSDGEVAVFDATNTTQERRKFLYQQIVVERGFKLFFVESICDDNTIIESNIKEVKIASPDYANFGEEEVVRDFRMRIEHYEAQYKPLDEALEPEYSFMKIFNCGKKVLVHKHEGHIQSRIVYYLMNIHVVPRTIYLCRHGQSLYNSETRLGGDSELTECGQEYSEKLASYINSLAIENLVVWTSWLKRTVQTAQHIKGHQERWKTLNEIDAGDCDGLTYNDIKERFPEEFACRDVDKFMYRYPNGESYEDLVGRMEPVIMELERKENVIVVGHQAVLRCLLGYFLEVEEDKMPYIEVPLHTVIKLTPVAYGCKREDVFIGPGCDQADDDLGSDPLSIDNNQDLTKEI